MKNKIRSYLEKLENEKDIRILLACETGSRAWGFPSPDSDFDIRIIYSHKKDWYLSLNEKKDSIQKMYENNDLDITGWDLRKSLRLLMKSNVALLERIQSHIIYKADDDFVKKIKHHAENCYSKISTMHHYLSMAKKLGDDLNQEGEYKLKKFFYVLRSATACKWILEKQSMPPIDFHIMLEQLNIDEKIINSIKKLIDLKATKSESYFHEGEKEIFTFIHECIKQAQLQANDLPSGNANLDELSKFFIESL